MEYIMEPYLWLRCTLWRSPWVDCLGLTTDETPVDSTNLCIMEEGNMGLELTIDSSSHIFSTYSRSSIALILLSSTLSSIETIVHVECDDIRVASLEIIQFTES